MSAADDALDDQTILISDDEDKSAADFEDDDTAEQEAAEADAAVAAALLPGVADDGIAKGAAQPEGLRQDTANAGLQSSASSDDACSSQQTVRNIHAGASA